MKKNADAYEVIRRNTEILSRPSPESADILRHDKPLPSVDSLKEIVELLRSIVFYGYFDQHCVNLGTIQYHMGVKVERLYNMLYRQVHYGTCFNSPGRCGEISEEVAMDITLCFIDKVPEIKRLLYSDVQAIFEGDPAAKSCGEVIYCYPAVRALLNHRVAHELLKLGVPIIPRIISEMAHSETGIDIHPGAVIGESFSIDHGTGVVIGETCIIGNNVRLFQGVTLGAKKFELDNYGHPIDVPRHPIIEDNVVVYANTSILGRITIGRDSVIGGNVWLTTDVAPGSHIVQRRADQSGNLL